MPNVRECVDSDYVSVQGVLQKAEQSNGEIFTHTHYWKVCKSSVPFHTTNHLVRSQGRDGIIEG